MQTADEAYRDLITDIIENGDVHVNRTGVNTRRIWGAMMQIDLTKGFPLLTTKKIATKAAFVELLGFVRGETDVRWYQERGCNIWNADHERWHGKDLERDQARWEKIKDRGHMNREWRQLKASLSTRQNKNTLGFIYGAQWRRDGQLDDIIEALKQRNPSRRLIMTAWNYSELPMMCLPPCHLTYHFTLRQSMEGAYVDVSMHQRSCDSALGLPFNLATTALLTHLVAHAASLRPGRMVWFGDDVHIYEPHIEQLQEQIQREPKESPRLRINAAPQALPWHVEYDDLEVLDYHPHPKVPFELFVG